MSGYLGPQPVPQATQHRQTVTASAGLTTITTSGYQTGYVDVWMNGVKLVSGTDFTANNGSTIVLASGAASGDVIEIIANVAFQLVGMTFTGDTSFTGTLKIPVWTTAARPASPAVGMIGYNSSIGQQESWNGSAWVTSGGLLMQSVQTASFTAGAGNSYPVNTTSGAVTVTLPASPLAGQQVQIIDYAGTFATNNLTINPNGAKINGATANSGVSTNRASVTLVYVDSTQGWVDSTIGNASYLPQLYSASYLVVAGGGGGANPYINDVNTCGGGGGAGGLLSGTSTLLGGTTYSVTVGAGGAGNSGVDQGGSGGSSVFNSLTAIGGGGGGRQSRSGASGGSGGGGCGTTGGSGTTGQGYAGGDGVGNASQGGGGGGAGAVGGTTGSSTGIGANGGIGVSSSITGSAAYYAGGGGGAGTNAAGTGGSGGGGNGVGPAGTATGYAGTANTGGGAGGSRGNITGANGGSGVVILSVATANYSGVTTGSPTVTTSGSNTILKFTSSGSYTA